MDGREGGRGQDSWCPCCSAWAFACKSLPGQWNKMILRTKRYRLRRQGGVMFLLKQKEVLMDVAEP